MLPLKIYLSTEPPSHPMSYSTVPGEPWVSLNTAVCTSQEVLDYGTLGWHQAGKEGTVPCSLRWRVSRTESLQPQSWEPLALPDCLKMGSFDI